MEKKLLWYNIAFMGFTTVWGFGNIINGFSAYDGLRAVIPWLIILLLYFLPYSLMVGELGSTFSKESGGVSAWVRRTMGAPLAYLSGWMYFVVHLPYISQKPSLILVASSWLVFGENRISNLSTVYIQLISWAIFIGAILLSLLGISFLKKLSFIAGTATFVMSILFILLMIAAPIIKPSGFVKPNFSLENFKPNIDLSFFLNLSILVFAVGGCEKISPYVNQSKRPGKDFPRGMLVLALMVAVCAFLGTVAMGMLYDSDNIPSDLLTNGAYYAFKQLGELYHLGNLFLIIYSLSNLVAQIFVIIFSIDAPLRMLMSTAGDDYIPNWLKKTNKKGVYTHGVILVGIIVSALIILPIIGISNLDQLVKWLVKLNSVCMPLRYLWVFLAYIMLKIKLGKTIESGEYRFIKNKPFGIIVGIWCLVITAVSCIMGMYSENTFELIMNIVTPVILIAIGFILPLIAKSGKKHLSDKTSES